LPRQEHLGQKKKKKKKKNLGFPDGGGGGGGGRHDIKGGGKKEKKGAGEPWNVKRVLAKPFPEKRGNRWPASNDHEKRECGIQLEEGKGRHGSTYSGENLVPEPRTRDQGEGRNLGVTPQKNKVFHRKRGTPPISSPVPDSPEGGGKGEKVKWEEGVIWPKC